MAWWIWTLIGLGLLAFEVVTPGGLVALFFGLGALVVASVTALTSISAPAQWLVFAVVSLASVAVLRRRLSARLALRSTPVIDSLIGETAVPLEALAPQAVGHAELRGTSWQARNVGPALLPAGQPCKVARLDGLILELTAR